MLARNQLIVCELPHNATVWHITCSVLKLVDPGVAEASSERGSAHRSWGKDSR
jgi:hypothetical protein